MQPILPALPHHPANTSSTAGALPGRALRELGTIAGRSLLASLIALALVLLVRRVGGAFVQPLGGGLLAIAAIALTLVAALARWLLTDLIPSKSAAQRLPLEHPVRLDTRILFALPGLAAILALAALTLAGTPAAAIAAAWFLMMAAEAASWLVAFASPSARRPRFLSAESRAQEDSRDLREAPDVDFEADLPAGLVQQLTRVRDENCESVHAVLVAEIPANDRQAAVHLAFCPPLPAKPELTAHALEAEDADVRITQSETFGARIEVRLPAVCAEKRQLVVEVLGSAICR